MDDRSPGADDNGSGIVVVLETLRVMTEMGFQPLNTLEFHFYAAEEDGLRGSDAIFKQYSDEDRHVLAMLQQDMAGYSPTGNLSIVTDKDFVHRRLTDFVMAVAKEYSDRRPTTTECGHACSDHASATKYKYRTYSEDLLECQS